MRIQKEVHQPEAGLVSKFHTGNHVISWEIETKTIWNHKQNAEYLITAGVYVRDLNTDGLKELNKPNPAGWFCKKSPAF